MISSRFHRWKEEEASKLSRMTFRKKAEYIAYYYKFYFLGLAAAVVLFLFAGEVLINRSKTVILSGLITNDDWNRFSASDISRDYASRIGLSSSQKLLLDDGLYIDEEGQAAEIAAASRGKIIAGITTKSLDFVITEKSVLDEFRPQMTFCSLNELLPDDLFRALRDSMATYTDENGKTVYYALSLKDSRYLTDAPEVTGTYYLFVPSIAPHREQTADFIRYCFEQVP
ncbi:MAG: hypothetical protein K5760_08745 [Clostridium sp.]|nr:hypothetical protein [Clostridium sp.]